MHASLARSRVQCENSWGVQVSSSQQATAVDNPVLHARGHEAAALRTIDHDASDLGRIVSINTNRCGIGCSQCHAHRIARDFREPQVGAVLDLPSESPTKDAQRLALCIPPGSQLSHAPDIPSGPQQSGAQGPCDERAALRGVDYAQTLGPKMPLFMMEPRQ